MVYRGWVPVQGEEVQVRFPCGYIEIAKFVKDNGDGTGVCRVGRKQRLVFANQDISENWNHYKKVKEDKEESKKPRRDEYDEYEDKYDY